MGYQLRFEAACGKGRSVSKLHDFANFAEEAGEGKVGLIPKVSRAFQEVVQRVAAEHRTGLPPPPPDRIPFWGLHRNTQCTTT